MYTLSWLQSNEAIRNALGMALRLRAAEGGVPSLVRALREHDDDQNGSLTKSGLRAAMLRLGLRVEAGSNMDRAWDALTERDHSGVGRTTQRVSLDRLVASIGSFESVPPRPRYVLHR